MKNLTRLGIFVGHSLFVFAFGCNQPLQEENSPLQKEKPAPVIKVEVIDQSVSAKKESIPEEVQEMESIEMGPIEVDELFKTADLENIEMAPMEPIPFAPPLDALPYPPIATPLSAPQEFAKHPFDPSVNVEPALANYVGSYGVLPSRLGSPPFLYSFEVPSDVAFDDDGHHRRR